MFVESDRMNESIKHAIRLYAHWQLKMLVGPLTVINEAYNEFAQASAMLQHDERWIVFDFVNWYGYRVRMGVDGWVTLDSDVIDQERVKVWIQQMDKEMVEIWQMQNL